MTIEIALTHGCQTIVDDLDADLLQLSWHAHVQECGRVYAERVLYVPKGRSVIMHRTILERILGRPLLKNELVDHRNGDSLDNRRSNLRLATHAQNSQNKKRERRNTSGYKGVTWNKKSKRWQSSIKSGGKSIYLGLFVDPLEAHNAYREKAIELFGEFARFE